MPGNELNLSPRENVEGEMPKRDLLGFIRESNLMTEKTQVVGDES